MTAISLDDKYAATSGRVFVSGTQALVRLPIEQARRDARAGHNTAGFISGYRGSPLGGYDNALWAAEKHLKANRIHFEPGINEDLAATSVWGTQQVPLLGGARYQGVFGMWYGKGPGVDRSADALKHANFAGTSLLGGVLALCGDDHAARSSTLAHQSDHALIHCGMPVFSPAGIQDFIDLGLMGFALSRFASVWVGFKCVTDIVDGSASILAGDDRIMPILPLDYEAPPGGLSIRHEVAALAQEARLFEERLKAAQAFARANHIDGVRTGASGRKRLGVVTTGKALADVDEALGKLGIDSARLQNLGIAVYKVGMVWPLEPERMRAFAETCDELIVIEEKRPVIEEQLASLLYNSPADRRPRLVGKRDLRGAPLVPATGELDSVAIMRVLAARIDELDGTLKLTDLATKVYAPSAAASPAAPVIRTASFCAGCPHSTSTKVPEGSVAIAGIGCHGMAAFMPDRATLPVGQMGGEGASWIGQAPFVDIPHIFQNLGDGTYFHSGLLAIRACVAAQVPITYKILLNGAVGMTGGQPIEGEAFDGEITAPRVAHQVFSEGVQRIAVVSDDADRFAEKHDAFPAGTSFHHRDELDQVQRELREYRGVSVLIYDQSCATERRRLRKRGKLPESTQRVMIATEVCEGCGDCGIQSGCIAIEPVETEFGRKRAINQSSCNQDVSCLKGFCPSFITVTGGLPKRAAIAFDAELDSDLPEPELPELTRSFSLLVTGIGGAGVVTIGAVLGMAAHIADTRVTVLDMSGFAQRNGSVTSHVRLGGEAAAGSMRIPAASVDLVIGCDPVVTANAETVALMRPDSAVVVLNRFVAPTSTFATDPDFFIDESMLERRIVLRIGEGNLLTVDATAMASKLLGNAIGANMMMLGYAWQAGLIPLSRQAILQAIGLNGAAVDMNLAAFALGRLARSRPEAVAAMLGETIGSERPKPDLESLIETRSGHLSAYQDQALARRYADLVRKVAAAEVAIGADGGELALVVADVYARLLAYKDEYEVARMLSGESVRSQLKSTFDGDFAVRYNLAPPLLSRRDPQTGRLHKRSFGAWLGGPLKLLSKFRWLRGTPFDPFGYPAHRRMERALIGEYEAIVDDILNHLAPGNLAAAIELARSYGLVRGFDVVKDANVATARGAAEKARSAFRAPSTGAEPDRQPLRTSA